MQFVITQSTELTSFLLYKEWIRTIFFTIMSMTGAVGKSDSIPLFIIKPINYKGFTAGE